MAYHLHRRQRLSRHFPARARSREQRNRHPYDSLGSSRLLGRHFLEAKTQEFRAEDEQIQPRRSKTLHGRAHRLARTRTRARTDMTADGLWTCSAMRYGRQAPRPSTSGDSDRCAVSLSCGFVAKVTLFKKKIENHFEFSSQVKTHCHAHFQLPRILMIHSSF